MTADEEKAAFDAAYTALLPYTKHAQVRAAYAKWIANRLRNYSPQVVAETLFAYPLNEHLHLNRTVLAEVVQAAVDAIKG